MRGGKSAPNANRVVFFVRPALVHYALPDSYRICALWEGLFLRVLVARECPTDCLMCV